MATIFETATLDIQLSPVALAAVLVLTSGWILQKIFMEISNDISDEVRLNASQIINEIFRMHEYKLMLAMEHWNQSILAGSRAFQQLYQNIQPGASNALTHPDKVLLETIFSNLISSSNKVLYDCQHLFNTIGRVYDPALIVNYNQYVHILDQLNNSKETMKNTTLESLETIIETMNLLSNN